MRVNDSLSAPIKKIFFKLWVCVAVVAGSGVFSGGPNQEDHAHHRKMLEKNRAYQRQEMNIDLPNVMLTNQSGEKVSLRALAEGEDTLLLQFIFTTCTTICPVMSASFSTFQKQLDPNGQKVKMVSITIDPEYDTVKKLAAYAKRHKAGRQWTLLTGSIEDIQMVQKALGAYYPGNNKMYHRPFTYLKSPKRGQWIRLDGLLSGGELMAEYHRLNDMKSLTDKVHLHH